MAALCWRLLVVFSLIFVTSNFVASNFVAPTLLRGQAAAGDRLPLRAPISGVSSAPLRYSPPSMPVWIPPAGLTRPGAPGTIGFQHRLFSQLVRSAGIIFSGR